MTKYVLTLDLEPGYNDPPCVMFYAAFQCLVDFVDGECGLKMLKYQKPPHLKKAGKKLRKLYNWYKNLDYATFDEHSPKAQKKFLKLAELRQLIWT